MPLGSMTTFMGQAVDATSILIRYTVTPDFTLNGTVNNDDVTVFNAYYQPGMGDQFWSWGDADYDGDVDNDDATLLNSFFNQSVE
jgi:hypothetical protein